MQGGIVLELIRLDGNRPIGEFDQRDGRDDGAVTNQGGHIGSSEKITVKDRTSRASYRPRAWNMIAFRTKKFHNFAQIRVTPEMMVLVLVRQDQNPWFGHCGSAPAARHSRGSAWAGRDARASEWFESGGACLLAQPPPATIPAPARHSGSKATTHQDDAPRQQFVQGTAGHPSPVRVPPCATTTGRRPTPTWRRSPLRSPVLPAKQPPVATGSSRPASRARHRRSGQFRLRPTAGDPQRFDAIRQVSFVVHDRVIIESDRVQCNCARHVFRGTERNASSAQDTQHGEQEKSVIRVDGFPCGL